MMRQGWLGAGINGDWICLPGRFRWAGLAILLLLAGCGPDPEGRLSLKGTVVFEGQPVPFGDIVFTPDGSRGASGPQGFATIEGGRYDTGRGRGRGVAGGPTVLTISAFRDGPGKGIIIETEFPVELPKEGGEFEIVIPVPSSSGAATPEQEVNF